MPTQISFDLKGRVVMITGASRGIGKAIALACAHAGADLALGSRHVEECEQVAAACRELGARARAWTLDVTQLPSIRGFVDGALAEFDTICAINFKAPYFASAMVAKSMIERGVKGSIINISSQVGHVGGPLRSAYAVAKGGLNSLTRSLAAEWARHGIRVTGVSPTFTRTEMMERAAQSPEFRKNFEKVPLGRPAEPEEIAAAVIYLASDAGGFVTGHTLLVDGGFTAV